MTGTKRKLLLMGTILLAVGLAVFVVSQLLRAKKLRVSSHGPGHAARQVLAQLDGGIRQFHGEHGTYPAPSELVRKLTTSLPKGEGRGSSGPYNGCEELEYHRALRQDERDVKAASGPLMFHDPFCNPIVYLRYDAEAGRFESGRFYAGIRNGLPADLDAYLKGEGHQFFRRDFVLITPGPNGRWEAVFSDGWSDSDDVVNFID